MSMFHRLEEYGFNVPKGAYIIVSFETEHRGIWQCRWNETGKSELQYEPPLESLKKDEQREVQQIGIVVYYFTHGEIPEDLSVFET